jgi:hypothetical protein
MGHGLAHPLGTLRSEQCLVDLGLVYVRAVKRLVLMSEDEPLTGGERPEALVSSGRREPGANSVRVLDPFDVHDQPHPGRLEDVRRVALDELEVPGNRPDEPTVLMNQVLPRLRIAVGGPPHQPGHIEIRDVGTSCREDSRSRPVGVLLRHYRASRHRPP